MSIDKKKEKKSQEIPRVYVWLFDIYFFIKKSYKIHLKKIHWNLYIFKYQKTFLSYKKS